MFTPEQIQLQHVPLDDVRNRTRENGTRVVWQWKCPGQHTYDGDTIATEEEPLLREQEILADPRCYSCRKAEVVIDTPA